MRTGRPEASTIVLPLVCQYPTPCAWTTAGERARSATRTAARRRARASGETGTAGGSGRGSGDADGDGEPGAMGSSAHDGQPGWNGGGARVADAGTAVSADGRHLGPGSLDGGADYTRGLGGGGQEKAVQA